MTRYLSSYFSSDILEQIYKTYVRPNLDFDDIIYHKYEMEITSNITKWLEQTQYLAALA